MQNAVLFVLHACAMFALIYRSGGGSLLKDEPNRVLFIEIPLILTILQIVIWIIFTFGPDQVNFTSGWLDFGTGYQIIELPFVINCWSVECSWSSAAPLGRTKIFLGVAQLMTCFLLNLVVLEPFLGPYFNPPKKPAKSD